MYEFFKNIATHSNCKSVGVCSIHPSVNSLLELFISEVREISFYLVKLKEFKIETSTTVSYLIDTLSIFLINTSFNQKKYLDYIQKLYSLKCEIKNKYVSYCKSNNLPCEIINSNFVFNKNTTISELIEFSENNIANKQKNCDKKKLELFELITIFVRLCAINIVKLKKLDKAYNKYDFELIRFIALTNSYSIRNEKLIRRILEFSNIAFEIQENLFKIYKEKYGTKENATINLNAIKGHSILVSGDDLNELENILKTIEYMQESGEIKENINVYTNGPLFLAHMYPYFKNNQFLKGHYGTDNAEYDFSLFSGSILITQNFIQKIDNLYRGEIFSNKIISFSKVFDISCNNYKPVINACLKLEGYSEDEKKKEINVKYNISEINKFIDEFQDDEMVIVTGKLNKDLISKYKDKQILNLNFPCEMDILINAIQKLKERNIKLTLFFMQCNLKSLSMVFSLLNKDVEITLGNCPHEIVSPHVTEALTNEFNVKII